MSCAAVLLPALAATAAPPAEVAWAREGVADAMAAGNGIIYLLGEGRLVALEVEDGAVVWRRDLHPGDKRPAAGPLVGAGIVVVGQGGTIHALEPRSGEMRWSVDLGGTIRALVGPPLVAGVDDDGSARIVALDGAGAIVAMRPVGERIYDLGLRDGTAVAIVGLGDVAPELLFGLGPRNLCERWRVTMDVAGDLVPSPPGVSPAGVSPAGACVREYSQRAERVFCLDAATGRVPEPLPAVACPRACVELDWDLFHITAEKGRATLFRVARASGALMWEAELPGPPSAVAWQGTRLVVAGDRGEQSYVSTLDGDTGRLLGTAPGPAGIRQIVVSSGRVLARTDGRVVALAQPAAPRN